MKVAFLEQVYSVRLDNFSWLRYILKYFHSVFYIEVDSLLVNCEADSFFGVSGYLKFSQILALAR